MTIDRRTVIEAIVLVFHHSGAKEMVGTDALRTVLEMSHRDMVVGGQLVTQPLWDLLEGQPAFDAEVCYPPLARLCQWSSRLDLEVVLPEQMTQFSEVELVDLADACDVPPKEFDRVFRGRRVGVDTHSDGAAIIAQQAMDEALSEDSKVKTRTRGKKGPRDRRQGLIMGAALLGVIGFVISGLTLYSSLRGPKLVDVPIDFSLDLPLSKAQQNGSQVGGTLSDPTWISLPAETQRKQLGDALAQLSAKGVTAIFVKDKRGNVVASAAEHKGRTMFELPGK